MFTKVLIANRGEIACRVIRALRELQVASVAVHSEADARSKHVRMADEAVLIGPAPSAESYLLVDKIMAAAHRTGAQAIHPGYGFLSESVLLRDGCEAAGLTFIGPSSHAMREMGAKTRARQVMQAAGVPIVPGSTEASANGQEGLAVANAIGFPVLLKASAGGGGKGMRLVETPDAFVEAFDACSREALASFGDGAVYMERAIIKPRHIEVQVLADSHGNVVHVFERECSVQRRHQKVVEEAPAANLSDDTRRKMGEVAIAAARAIGYENAGTIEFLADQDENFYFLEMNTRLQVEHPVSELISGVDLVRSQIRIAAGEPLSFTQADLTRRGHAIECRLYAEDPYGGFVPSPGPLTRYRPPAGPGIRVDDGVDEGDVVSTHYDPMIAKMCAWAEDRPSAIARMRAALKDLRVAGIKTNRQFLDQILVEPAFVAGQYATDLISTMDMEPPEIGTDRCVSMAAVAAIVAARREARRRIQVTPPESAWAQFGRAEGLMRS
ncbi:MAG: acetyl-CoA carboxylase biotin carboxylase subunit [Myxococcota bacterium]|jgi:acetyl-CoA carboxylase biotin carboxylase subunit